MRRVHFCNTVGAAHVYAKQHGGGLLSTSMHPDAEHKSLKAFREGTLNLLVCDWSRVTGWRVEGDDIVVSFDEDFPKAGPEREQAESRVKNPGRLL